MSQKTIKIIGWSFTAVLGLVFIFSAYLKLSQNSTAVAQATAFGFSPTTYFFIGLIEITSLALFIIPKTGVLGTLLLVAYLGGAIVTHLQHQESIMMPVIIQILVWLTAIIRFQELRVRLFRKWKI